MTQWGYEDNDSADQDNDNELDGPKALRDAYKSLRKQQDESNAMIRELLNEKKQAQLASVFESLGVPGAASVYQGDADPEKAKAWVQSMQATFGGNTQGSNPASVADSVPAISADDQARLQRMTEAGQAGTPMGAMDAAYAAVGDAKSNDDLVAMFQRLNHQ